MRERRFLVLLVISTIIALTPLAHASPPDQTWISGIYDNADYDDVVLLITGGVSTVETGVLWSLGPVSAVVSRVVQPDSQIIWLVPLPSNPSRAPPTA